MKNDSCNSIKVFNYRKYLKLPVECPSNIYTNAVTNSTSRNTIKP